MANLLEDSRQCAEFFSVNSSSTRHNNLPIPNLPTNDLSEQEFIRNDYSVNKLNRNLSNHWNKASFAASQSQSISISSARVPFSSFLTYLLKQHRVRSNAKREGGDRKEEGQSEEMSEERERFHVLLRSAGQGGQGIHLY